MAFYKQSTAYTRTFKMIDSADHLSKKTGLTCTVNLSKAGAAFAAAGGAVSEVANGWYKVALSTTDTNTLGDLSFYITASGADDTDFVDQVVARDLADLCFPTTSGRSLDVTATGEAGIDWSNVGAPTTTLALTGTTIATTQKVDIETIKTNAVVNGGTITFPTTATLASTTNITSATGIDVTKWNGGTVPAVNVTGVPLVDLKYTLGTISPAAAGSVRADLVNSLTEPTAVVAASPTAIAALSWLLTLSRNKITQTATTQLLKADDGTTTIATSTVSDDGTTATRGEFA